MARIAEIVKNMPFGRVVVMPLRLGTVNRHYFPKAKLALRWLIKSREHTNLTYDLTPTNLNYLAHTISFVTGDSVAQIEKYMQEPLDDFELINTVRWTARHVDAQVSDDTCKFGRRLGWYAIVRSCRPRLVVETGVDKGLGAVLLCSALMRNSDLGSPGEYIGTDINPNAGAFFQAPYNRFGKIMYGDSIESLKKLTNQIDVFINDSDHSAEYEYREYRTIAANLSSQSIILGDNSHLTDKLMKFSREAERDFLFFKEEPDHHWFPGGGIGFSFHRHC
jgi:predicted O-methyltransferase YrrM